MKCCLCKGEIEKLMVEGKVVWAEGHNAEPIKRGRCCSDCNETKVLARRIKDLASRR